MGSRAEEAAAMAEAIGIAFEEDRQRAIIMRAKSRAEERIAQRYAEGRY
jgi:pyruvoyl-dependent arginine decarboxylase (PvlArgDC)